jgi:DNA-binding transcriptional regulator YhcF (GntR family)
LRARHLKDIGRVQLFTVRRAHDDFEREGPFERARRRREAIREKVADVVDRRRAASEGDEGDAAEEGEEVEEEE